MSILTGLRLLLSRIHPVQALQPRVYICAPHVPATSAAVSSLSTALIIPVKDEADRITERVHRAFAEYQVVIVLDDGSSDFTAHVAAEAGATVVLCEPGQPFSTGIQRAAQLAFCLADRVVIDCEG
jgi:hypothetical protein